MTTHRVSLGFRRISDPELVTFGMGIVEGLADNPAYPDPLIPLPILSESVKAFDLKLILSNDGGRRATAEKNLARRALITFLRQQASYVQGHALHDLPKLLSSGFNAMSNNRSPQQLEPPHIVSLHNSRNTQIVARVNRIRNARSYEVRIRTVEQPWKSSGIFTQSRRISITDLTPGTVYDIQIRAIGGSTGYSDWSDITSKMST